jgi:hypothetical protein
MRRRQLLSETRVTGVSAGRLAHRAGSKRPMPAGKLQVRSETLNVLQIRNKHCVARPEQFWVPVSGRAGVVLAYPVRRCAAILLRS